MCPKPLAIVGALFCTEAVVIAMLPLCVCVMHHAQMALRHSCLALHASVNAAILYLRNFYMGPEMWCDHGLECFKNPAEHC